VTQSTELVSVEQPQQLITIEPKKYVELVFEPFAKQLTGAIDSVRSVDYDVKTTAGIAVATKCRALFRAIRVECEKARKTRKAPILEIGRLLDSRYAEIESSVLPLETFFDEDIKAEDARKEAEKQAKAASEKARIDFIRKRISEIQAIPSESVGRSAADLAATIELTQALEITLQEFGEFSGECETAKVAALARLREMQEAQRAHEAEQARIQAEREQLAKERAEADERERLAAVERQRAEGEQRAAKAKADAAMLAEQQAAQRKIDAQRREVEQQQAAQQAIVDKLLAAESEIHGIQQQVIIATQGRLGVRKGGTIDCIRETLDETEAWEIDAERFGILAGAAESAKTTAVAEIRRLLAEAEAREAAEADAARIAQAEADRIFAERDRIAAEQAAEARHLREEQEAAERERIHRELIEFERNGPGDVEIVKRLATDYGVVVGDVMQWLKKFDYEATDEYFASENMEKAA
jgi:hypothetical protein